jgi:hypothetical protein
MNLDVRLTVKMQHSSHIVGVATSLLLVVRAMKKRQGTAALQKLRLFRRALDEASPYTFRRRYLTGAHVVSGAHFVQEG